jgi:hypothetical protein
MHTAFSIRRFNSESASESKRDDSTDDRPVSFPKIFLELRHRNAVCKGKARPAAREAVPHFQMKTIKARNLIVAAAYLFLASCSLIAPFDQAAYDKATSTKAEALALMDKATSSYSSNEKQIDQVSLDIDKAYEYDRGRLKNTETVKQWELLRDPNGHLFGGFIRHWRDKGSLKPDYIVEKKKDIADAFDQIIGLERGKRGAN